MDDLETRLLNALTADRKYAKINHLYEKMRYAVAKHGKLMAKYGEHVLEQCALYEQDHSKSPEVAAEEWLTVEDIYCKHLQNRQSISEEEYAQLHEAADRVIRSSPQNWNDWKAMLSMFKLYLFRAEVEFDCQQHNAALSDLRHATSVLKFYNNPEEIYAHFEGADTELLSMMLSLQRDLMEPCLLEMSFEVKPITTRQDVDEAIAMIRKNDSLYETYEMNSKSTLRGNLKYSDKALLVNTAEEGRFMKATSDIEQFERILVERAEMVVTFPDCLLTYCDFCHRKMITFWPCSKCSEIGYCSFQCSKLAFEQYHQSECGLFGFILGDSCKNYSMALAYRHYATFGIDLAMACEDEQALGGNDKSHNLKDFFASTTIRNMPHAELSKADKRILCRALTTQLSHRGERDPVTENYQTVKSILLAHCFFHKGILKKKLIKNMKMYSILLEHLSTAIMRMCTNAFSWDEVNQDGNKSEKISVGCVTSLAASMLNHSCDPNVNWGTTEGVLHLHALRHIPAGQNLSLSYGPRPHIDFFSRQIRLRRDYCFFCRCELCMFDSANRNDTLKCRAPGEQCHGPLVPTVYRACLKCGYKVSQSACGQMAASGQRASIEFMHIIKTVYQPDTRSNVEFVLNAVGIGRKSKPNLGDGSESDTASGQSFHLDKMDVLLSSPEQIAQLEKQLDICTYYFFGGSYHLLEKCALLLKVYSDSNQPERGLRLLDPLARSVEAIIPARTDWTFVKLLNLTDFAARFFEQLADSKCTALPAAFWELCRQLNTKLVQILQYDLQYRGDFFPVSNLRLDKSEPVNVLQENEEVCYDTDEMYFRQLFRDCHRRLQALDNVSGAEMADTQ